MLEKFPELLAALQKCDEPVAVYPDLLEHVNQELRKAEGLQREKALLARQREPDFLEGLLKLPLLPYQKGGVVFCAMRGRTLLADDMGLGKTAQAIGAAELMARERGIRRVLVICPASLKHQWEAEIRRFTDRTCLVLSGGLRRRGRAYAEGTEFFHVVNYEAVLADISFLKACHYDVIILDEAQRIKNWKTKTSRTVKSLRSPFCIVLTGTPLENRLEELYNIVQYVDERLLGPAFQFMHEHVEFDAEMKTKAIGYKGLDVLRDRLKPICLRRKKDEVLKELPPRTDKNFYIDITPAQRDAYLGQARILAGLLQKWRRRGFLTPIEQQRLMMALTNMRMICNSLYLFDKLTRDEPKLDELARLVEDLALGLKEKVLIFSQWEGTHRLLEPRLQKLGIGYALLCGKVPVNARGRLIQQFREDVKLRILLSTDAGGLGLNLQAASCVVIVEIPWNPAVLNQRVGRAHRLGQQRPVRVFNLLARGTIEEHIWDLLAFKQDLFAGVFDGASNQVVMRPRGQNRFLSAVDDLLKKDPSLVSPEAPVHAPEKAAPLALPAPAPAPELSAAADQVAAPLVDFLGAMARALLGSAGPSAAASPLPLRVTREEGTGQPLLALSLADREKVRAGVESLADALKGLAASLR
jgi:SNF2 family DNA or RNA helicase